MYTRYVSTLGDTSLAPENLAQRLNVLQTFLTTGTPLYRLSGFHPLMSQLPHYEYVEASMF